MRTTIGTINNLEDALRKTLLNNKQDKLPILVPKLLEAAKRRVPIFLWLSDIENGAKAQYVRLSQLPFVYHHVAGMPDSHEGYGMPIGGVIATTGVVIPYAVGSDVACGMCFIKTNIKDISIEDLKKIMSIIREVIPVGMKHHSKEQDWHLAPMLDVPVPVIHDQYRSALKQLGTLGGGNHFIEIQRTSDGYIGIMIHSGSRNLGKRVCDHYHELAQDLNEKWNVEIPRSWKLAYLPIESDEGQDYIREMNWCVGFAYANRKLMMERVLDAFKEVLDINGDIGWHDEMINIAHNYASMENHFGKNVMVHRKGATLAREGTIGIIPGSQGTKSYIVRGKGNPDSFMSCSHGAGRRMGRGQARRELDLTTETRRLNDLGIIHGIRTQDDLDEAAGAYKDISVVMKNQEDLVDIITELTPMAVIKGPGGRKRR